MPRRGEPRPPFEEDDEGVDPTPGLDDPREMTFLEHLEDLRGTLLRCFLSLVLGCVAVGVALPWFAKVLNHPLEQALEGRGDKLFAGGLRTDGVMDAFTIVLQMCFLGGLVLALPFMLWFIAGFVSPGLTRREKAVLRPGLAAGFGLFLAGAALSYFVLVPAAIKASFYLNDVLGLTPVWSAEKYYGMLIWMTVGVGLSFEFPLVLLVLLHLGMLSTARLRAFRSYAVVVFLVVAAIITPSGDPLTFLLLAAPLYLLYELTILVGAVLERRRAEELDEDPLA